MRDGYLKKTPLRFSLKNSFQHMFSLPSIYRKYAKRSPDPAPEAADFTTFCIIPYIEMSDSRSYLTKEKNYFRIIWRSLFERLLLTATLFRIRTRAERSEG
ncbi:MAG: hypothetical protein ACLRSW_03495, partial [Christensenellaceae bacterium]